MALYCGMDLHSTNTLVVIINEHDARISNDGSAMICRRFWNYWNRIERA